VLQYYQSGKRLHLPSGCPADIYRLMLECWDMDPYRRKKPQAIMRDVNQILYQGILYSSISEGSYSYSIPSYSFIRSWCLKHVLRFRN
jgi:hypothetical protein